MSNLEKTLVPFYIRFLKLEDPEAMLEQIYPGSTADQELLDYGKTVLSDRTRNWKSRTLKHMKAYITKAISNEAKMITDPEQQILQSLKRHSDISDYFHERYHKTDFQETF